MSYIYGARNQAPDTSTQRHAVFHAVFHAVCHADGDRHRGYAVGRPGVALVTGGQVPVLWITGPAGVGKSTVSWLLFNELAGSRTRAAFADADQLCMCYPAPPDDPGRDRIRARNASAVIGNYQAAGARCVIVNGVVDPAVGVPRNLTGPGTVLVAGCAQTQPRSRDGWPAGISAAAPLRPSSGRWPGTATAWTPAVSPTWWWTRPASRPPRWPGWCRSAAAAGLASAR